jgi:hypothetical protein
VARLLNDLPAAPWDDWLEAGTAQYDCKLRGAGYTVAFAVRRGGMPWTKVVSEVETLDAPGTLPGPRCTGRHLRGTEDYLALR